MFLLSGNSLTPAKKIPMQSLSVTLKERESVATMVPLDMNGIYYNSWFLDEAYPNGGTVWRVKSITQAYNTHTPTVQLEHVIYLLKDRLMFGEIKPGDMAGNANATTCTAEQAIRYILSYQEDWVLGDFGYAGVSNPYKFNGDSLFDALETVTKSLKNAWWVCDTTVYPFRLSIIQKNNDVFSEMRCGRNIKTISRTVDKSGMYTRFYPIGKDDLHIDGDYIEMNSYQYGIIAKVDTDTSIDSKDELRRWAIEQLEIHSEPVITIEVDGFELADATGEPLDKLTLGRICRVPLPEYGTTITERIVSIQYPDKVRQPQVAKVTLSNSKTDVMKVIAEEFKKNKGGGRAAAKQQEEDHAYMIDTKDKVGMVAKSIVGSGPGAWERISSLIVDGEGIHAKVERNEQGLVTAFTQIDLNENRILQEAWRAQNAETELDGKIIIEADRITQEVTERKNGQTTLEGKITVQADRITQEVTDRTNADATLHGEIVVEADRITTEVSRATDAEAALAGRLTVQADQVSMAVGSKDVRQILYFPNYYRFPQPGSASYRYYDCGNNKYYEWKNGAYVEIAADNYIKAGEICIAINADTSTDAYIDATRIHLLGQTIANTISANYIQTKIASLASLNVASLTSERGGVDVYSVETTTYEQGGITCYVPNGIWNLKIENNKLYRQRFNDDAWTEVGTFSNAISSWVWGGGSGKINVTALPQDQTKSVNVSIDGQGSITANGTYTYTVDYENSDGDDVSTGATKSVTVNVSQRSVDDIRIAGTASAYKSGNNVYKNITISADYDTGGSHTETEVLDVTDAYDLGAAAGESLVTDITLWEGNTQLSGEVSLSSSKTVKAWCKYNGTWKEGAAVTFKPQNPSYNYSLYCADAVAASGSVTYTFTTTLTSGSFAKGSSYGFWRG